MEELTQAQRASARIDECFKKYGIFFAFNKDQLKKGVDSLRLQPDEKIVHLGVGMYCKKSLVKAFNNEFNEISAFNAQERISEEGLVNVIKSELSNHECYYSNSITDAIKPLADLGIEDIDLISEIFYKELSS